MEEEKMDALEPSNEIIDISQTDEEIEPEEEVSNKNNKKQKKKKIKRPSKWSRLSKKKKIIIICGIILFIIIIGLLLYFLVFKKEKVEKEKEPVVVIEKDNYRYEDGTLVFLNDKDEEIGKYECENKKEDKCYIPSYSNEDEFDVEKIVDEKGSTLEKFVKIYQDRYAFIVDTEKEKEPIIKVYDIKKEKILDDNEYELVKLYKDDLLIVKNSDGKYGIIDVSKGIKDALDFDYDYLGFIPNLEHLVAKKDSNSYLIDSEGKELSKAIKGDIKLYNNKFISVVVDDNYYLYDYNGIIALDQNINHINFSDNFVLIVDNKKLSLYDASLNLLNLDPIKLPNTYYNPVIKVDKDGKTIERNEAYKVVLRNDNLSVEIDGEYTLVNIYTGKINKNTPFMNYYNGIMYIYSDAEKEILLGTYPCGYANTMTSTTTSYTTCTLAGETELLNRGLDTANIGVLPIYNNRFIFMKDNSNIVLFDLVKKEKKATYTAVDAGYYNQEMDFVATDGTLVMAKNTSGNFGIIKIESKSVTGVIGFKDDTYGGATTAIRYLDNYFLVTRADGKYYLYANTGGKDPLATSTEEIVEYNKNAIIVKGSEEIFNVNTLKGKVILGNLVYVKFFDDYFVAISKDKKINVYKYEENAKGLVTDEIPTLTTSEYESCYSVSKDTLTVGGVNYVFSLEGEE